MQLIAHRRVVTLPDRGLTERPLQLKGMSGRSIDRVGRMRYLPARRRRGTNPYVLMYIVTSCIGFAVAVWYAFAQ